MSLRSWLYNLRSVLTLSLVQRHRRRGAPRAATYRPYVEALEDRALPSFSAPVDYPVGDNSHALVTADFNNDGHLDLATANYDFNADFGNVLYFGIGAFTTAFLMTKDLPFPLAALGGAALAAAIAAGLGLPILRLRGHAVGRPWSSPRPQRAITKLTSIPSLDVSPVPDRSLALCWQNK